MTTMVLTHKVGYHSMKDRKVGFNAARSISASANLSRKSFCQALAVILGFFSRSSSLWGARVPVSDLWKLCAWNGLEFQEYVRRCGNTPLLHYSIGSSPRTVCDVYSQCVMCTVTCGEADHTGDLLQCGNKWGHDSIGSFRGCAGKT